MYRSEALVSRKPLTRSRHPSSAACPDRAPPRAGGGEGGRRERRGEKWRVDFLPADTADLKETEGSLAQ
jgi:hypothetical protein